MKTYKELRQQIAEATKWKKGDGRPRGGSHIENVKFWDLPDASLKYIQKDASAAMKANPEGKKAGKYADEVNDAATVLFWRKKNKIVVESVELDETTSPSNAAIEFFKKKLKGRFSEKKMSSTTHGSETWWNHKGTTLQFKESVELEEAKKLKASDIVKMMKDPEDWGADGKDKVYTKGSNFVYIDSFYFTGDKALKELIKEWSPKGSYYQYFKDEYGCNLKIVDSFIEAKATGKHKKLSKDGIIGVELKVE